MHWITISTIDVTLSTIRVYDSNHGQLPQDVQKLVADILQSNRKSIEVQYMYINVHIQQDPSTMFFDELNMRQHLITCLENGKISLFPVCGKRSPERYTMDTFPIYCIL